jgi:hypothetical protein
LISAGFVLPMLIVGFGAVFMPHVTLLASATTSTLMPAAMLLGLYAGMTNVLGAL